jgi:muramidase (phage lysozyme)
MISKSEGTFNHSTNQIEYGRIVNGQVLQSPFNPSLVGKTNVVISDFSRYPQMLVRVRAGLNSSAAGGFQVIKNTWNGAAAAMGITDFSPLSQQLVAVELLRQRGAIPYILKNDLPGAFANTTLAKEWASFAGAGYGQGEHSIAKLNGWFQSALSGVSQVASNVRETIEENPGVSSAVVVVGVIALFF